MFFEKDYNAGEEPSKPQTWMEPMIKEFYDVMGWDQQGQPTPEKLADLGIISLQHNSEDIAIQSDGKILVAGWTRNLVV